MKNSNFLDRLKKGAVTGIAGVTAIGMMAGCSDTSSSNVSVDDDYEDDCDRYSTNADGDEICDDTDSSWYGFVYLGGGYYNTPSGKVHKSSGKSYFSKAGSGAGVTKSSGSTSTKSGGFSSGAKGGFGG